MSNPMTKPIHGLGTKNIDLARQKWQHSDGFGLRWVKVPLVIQNNKLHSDDLVLTPNPFKALKSLPILNSTKFLKKKGFPL